MRQHDRDWGPQKTRNRIEKEIEKKDKKRIKQ
jgi:hypothetical protein